MKGKGKDYNLLLNKERTLHLNPYGNKLHHTSYDAVIKYCLMESNKRLHHIVSELSLMKKPSFHSIIDIQEIFIKIHLFLVKTNIFR